VKSARETVHSLEQEETGEMRRLRCPMCGQRSFRSIEELNHHKARCAEAQAQITDSKSA
jgi:hypothetical protein